MTHACVYITHTDEYVFVYVLGLGFLTLLGYLTNSSRSISFLHILHNLEYKLYEVKIRLMNYTV